MRRPSGNQEGENSPTSGVLVRFLSPVPSASMTQISNPLSSIQPSKAICEPSGDHTGGPMKPPSIGR